MERIPFTRTDDGFHIEGFPNAVKVLKLDVPRARLVADLLLHQADLDFALRCVNGINLVPEEPVELREGLWRSAIVHFIKCFGKNKSRFSLALKQVYKGDLEALAAFRYFKNLRDKHVVHDENAFSQCLPSAILNRQGFTPKVARIWCLKGKLEILTQGAYGNLHLLITRASEWVVKEFDHQCDALAAELEKMSYEDLCNFAPLTFRATGAEEVDVPR
jgi:hypothetical protein